MNSLTIEQLDDLIQTSHPEEQKIKDLLDSPTEENQLLGLQLARSVLSWSFYDIGYYVLNSGKGWEHEEYITYNYNAFSKTFCGHFFQISSLLKISELRIDWFFEPEYKYKSLFSGSELEKTKAETSEFIRKICEENSIL